VRRPTQRRRATIGPQRGVGVDNIHLIPRTLHPASLRPQLVRLAPPASHGGGMPLVLRRQLAGTFTGAMWGL
jgi:hypothetical protein